MKIAVSFHNVGFAFTALTIFSVKPSNRLSLDDDGWPSTKPLGLTNETAGSLPSAMSAYRFAVSWMCAWRTASLAMMEVSYWKGLQMLQYSSALVMVWPRKLVEPAAP